MFLRLLALSLGAGLGMTLASALAATQTAPSSLGGIDLLSAVKDVGFPAAAFVALLLLVRTTLRDHTNAINDLTVAIKELRVHCSEREWR